MLYPTELRAQLDYQTLTKAAPDVSGIVPRNRAPLQRRMPIPFCLICRKQNKRPGVRHSSQFQRLYRFVPSGMIFARFKIRGKQVRKSLETPDLALARRKLIELEHNEISIAHEHRRGRRDVWYSRGEPIQFLNVQEAFLDAAYAKFRRSSCQKLHQCGFFAWYGHDYFIYAGWLGGIPRAGFPQ
jgi:hypothetical protein